MRLALVALLVIVTGSFVETVKADPYRWCAEYGGGGQGGGGTNCYFVTLEQCRAAISGMEAFVGPTTSMTVGQWLPLKTEHDPGVADRPVV
jgi:hypothetical protein